MQAELLPERRLMSDITARAWEVLEGAGMYAREIEPHHRRRPRPKSLGAVSQREVLGPNPPVRLGPPRAPGQVSPLPNRRPGLR